MKGLVAIGFGVCAVTLLGAESSYAQVVPAPPAQAMATNPVEQVPVPQASTVGQATNLLNEAESLLAADKKDQARDKLLAALDVVADETLRSRIEEKLGKVNVELVRLPWPLPEKVLRTVHEGDSVRAIAQEFGTTVDLIVESNQLKKPDVIKPGDRLRVFSGKLAITASKSRNDLLVTSNGRFFKRYRVGTGKYDRTPVGTFVISDRIKEPVWWRADGRTIPYGDKENILGTRWLALKATGSTEPVKGYGIHGTWDSESIGKAESAGCIRLRNEDVEELFLLIPIGTEVKIEE